MQSIFARLIPFILLGVAIVAFAIGMIVMAYIFIFGAALGLFFFAIAWLRSKFFAEKTIVVTKRGRTIDHDNDHPKRSSTKR
jgi:hypothetical protein